MQSQINKYLVPAFGNFQLRDVEAEAVQRFIAGLDLSPKDGAEYIHHATADAEVG